MAPQPPDQVSWGDRSGKVVSAGKHGVVVGANGSKHKLFWDEVESIKKPGKDGESTGKAEPGKVPGKKPNLGPGLVRSRRGAPGTRGRGLEGHAQGDVDQLLRAPGPSRARDRPERRKDAWAHNRFQRQPRRQQSQALLGRSGVGGKTRKPRGKHGRNGGQEAEPRARVGVSPC